MFETLGLVPQEEVLIRDAARDSSQARNYKEEPVVFLESPLVGPRARGLTQERESGILFGIQTC